VRGGVHDSGGTDPDHPHPRNCPNDPNAVARHSTCRQHAIQVRHWGGAPAAAALLLRDQLLMLRSSGESIGALLRCMHSLIWVSVGGGGRGNEARGRRLANSEPKRLAIADSECDALGAEAGRSNQGEERGRRFWMALLLLLLLSG
jgi:hypothetical protein